jgi:hypothetical protein
MMLHVTESARKFLVDPEMLETDYPHQLNYINNSFHSDFMLHHYLWFGFQQCLFYTCLVCMLYVTTFYKLLRTND